MPLLVFPLSACESTGPNLVARAAPVSPDVNSCLGTGIASRTAGESVDLGDLAGGVARISLAVGQELFVGDRSTCSDYTLPPAPAVLPILREEARQSAPFGAAGPTFAVTYRANSPGTLTIEVGCGHCRENPIRVIVVVH